MAVSSAMALMVLRTKISGTVKIVDVQSVGVQSKSARFIARQRYAAC
jgi:hypothetical protein